MLLFMAGYSDSSFLLFSKLLLYWQAMRNPVRLPLSAVIQFVAGKTEESAHAGKKKAYTWSYIIQLDTFMIEYDPERQ